MADVQTEDLTALAVAPATGDQFIVNDISDTSDDSGGTLKRITYANLLSGALAELGITSSAAELNILDGATLSVTELNYVDGVTSAIQTQLDTKAPLASPAFTGTVILPKTLEIQDTSADHQYVLAVSELTADRTMTLPLLTGTDTFAFQAHTQTFTNKRNTKRTVTVTQAATPTINTDNTDVAYITGLAQAITSMTTNLSGTPVANDSLIISITDNGTARAITWGASFESSGNVTLPSTTVISTRLDVGFLYNAATSKWRCVATA